MSARTIAKCLLGLYHPQAGDLSVIQRVGICRWWIVEKCREASVWAFFGGEIVNGAHITQAVRYIRCVSK